MMYISTRGNYPPVTASQAIGLGMVPEGGLFVPQSLPILPSGIYTGASSYKEVAGVVFELLLTDFTEEELRRSIDSAYNDTTFDLPEVVKIVELGPDQLIMELWHGPTAAFKDVALQIMPHLLSCAKKKTGNSLHTVILVATSGDTGKAALEGFKNADGISIIVFYPHEGVSEIQQLQMTTTDGNNTSVVAVHGNFDDCQTGVKELFADATVRMQLRSSGIEFSSANSINWGRLCPQIIYYFTAYGEAVRRGSITNGETVDFCVPTGNFGNILAGYYARCMGLPVDKLICASNKNKVLADFFATGTYSRNREFFKTNSPSMDILISSNLERFLYAMTGGDSRRVTSWYEDLAKTGSFTIDQTTREAIDEVILSGWVDEAEVLSTINSIFAEHHYILDTHTAVGVALSRRFSGRGRKTIIASTASPYKFSCDVLGALEGTVPDDEFICIDRLSAVSGTPIHQALSGLRDRPVLHNRLISLQQMRETVLSIINDAGLSGRDTKAE
ncbi:MAG: threonine synthase [Chitinispirillaceae bacterium]|nr:threonine synthase [Chitinispirillaceae bacterium]